VQNPLYLVGTVLNYAYEEVVRRRKPQCKAWLSVETNQKIQLKKRQLLITAEQGQQRKKRRNSIRKQKVK